MGTGRLNRWLDRMWLTIAALCLALGIALLAGCEPLKENRQHPEPTRTPIQYGTPK